MRVRACMSVCDACCSHMVKESMYGGREETGMLLCVCV